VHESPLAVWVDTAPWSHLPPFFWWHVLRRVCEGRLGVGLIKEKPLLQLLERLALPAAKRRDGWLSLKKEARALLVGTTLVLFRDIFPGHHEGRVWVAEPAAPAGTPVGRAPSTARLGGWQLTLREGAASTPGPVTLWSFLSGRFEASLSEASSYATAEVTGRRGAPHAPPRPLLPHEACGGAPRQVRKRAGDKCGHVECITPGLNTLEGSWPGLTAAVPQLIPLDVPVDASGIVVEYEYVRQHLVGA